MDPSPVQTSPYEQSQSPPVFTKTVPAPPLAPSKQLIDDVTEFVPEWLAAANAMQASKLEDQLRLENMMRSRLRLDYWNQTNERLTAQLERLLNEDPDPTDWNSQMIIAVAPFIFAYADNSFATIFSTDEWLKVRPKAGTQESSVEDQDYSTAEKLTAMVIRQLTCGKIQGRLYEALLHCALYGRVFARLVWDEKQVPQFLAELLLDPQTVEWAPNPDTGMVEPVPGSGQPAIDPQTGKEIVLQTQRTLKTVFAHPKIELIQPDNILPDPNAVDDDLQTWTGIGYVTEVTRTQVLQRFKDGSYNLNKKEFEKAFSQAMGSPDEPVGQLGQDSARVAGTAGKTPTTCKAWEYHGYAVTTDGDVEIYCTWLTTKDADTPVGGILVQLWEGTALGIGLRPFMTAQYTPWGVEGQGAVQPHFDYIWTISHLLNLMIDNLRLQVNAMWEVVEGSPAHRALNSGDKNADKDFPGKYKVVGELQKEVAPFTQPALPYGELMATMKELKNDLQLATGVYTMRGGGGRNEKTASEVHQLAAQEAQPMENRLQIFVENFLNPALTMALAAIQQNTLAGVTIPIQDSHGIDQYVEVTSDEIRTGEYEVSATLGRQNAMKLAQAQTIERVLQLLPNLAPLIANEGNLLAVTPLYRSLLEKLEIERIKEHIRPLTPAEQMQMQAQQAMAAAGAPPDQPGPGGPPGQGPGEGGGPPELPQIPPMNNDQLVEMLLQMQSADGEGRTQQQ